MSDQALYYFQIASTLSVLFPIVIGLIRFQRLEYTTKIFLFFLVVGFSVDLCGWYLYIVENKPLNLNVRHVYDLFEILFFTWLVSRLSDSRFIKRSFFWLLPVLLLSWLWRFVDLNAMSIFKSAAQVLIAFASSYSILRLIESEPGVSKITGFWLLLGVFFYCFSTFFIMGLLATRLSKVWYMHDAINIITNLIYFVGLIMSTPSSRRSPSASF